MRRALVVIEDAPLCQALQLALHAAGFQTVGVSSPREAERELASGAYELVVSRTNGAALALTARQPSSAPESEPSTHPEPEPMAGGAGPGPGGASSGAGEGRLGQPEHMAGGAGPSQGPASDCHGLVGTHPRLLALLAALAKVAPYKTTVLVRGESGTGKELVARALHALSPRRSGPFVAVSCGAIPAGLLESELFGHERGAFTDAVRDRPGMFERASGGTLFLDEVGELPLAMQVSLLRVLQEDCVRRVGGSVEIPVDVRVVGATARDLESEVVAGRFREDLFYRLDVLSLRLPPLRERSNDVPSLVAHFIARSNQRLGLSVVGVSGEALRALRAYRWPGNVRELENVIERAAVLAEGAEIGVELLPARVVALGDDGDVSSPVAGEAGDLSIKRTARRMEEELIRRALARTDGNRTRAAEFLEISHRALLYKIKEYKIGPGG